MTPNGPRARALAAYVVAAAVAIAAAVIMLELWSADLRVPFDYGGDALFSEMMVKSLVEHGSYLRNTSLGAPGHLLLYDFPLSDTFQLLITKVLGFFTQDWAMAFNLYFLLGFPLTTMAAMAVFRHFRISFGPALVASVLYAFLPSCVIKGEGHIFLDVFFQVPLAILVMLWVAGPEPPLVRAGASRRWPRPDLRNRRALATALIWLVVTFASGYYAFFAAVLVLAAGIWGSFQRRSLTNVTAGLVLCAAVVAGLLVNKVPTLIYQHRQGPNLLVAARQSGEAELYGMKIAQLVLPSPGHRLAPLRNLNHHYAATAPLVGENGATALGFAGLIGFLFLLGCLVAPERSRAPGPRDDLVRTLSVFNLIAVLLATIGGFGALAALVVPEIRTYSRMNVFIAFYALFAFALLLERLQRRAPGVVLRALPVLLSLGLLDQTPASTVRPYASTREEYAGDAAFVKRIESLLPPGAMIFELPYVGFPEGGQVNQTHSYDLLRPSLHSHQLRWSFPTMHGRDGEIWQSETAGLEPGEMLANLAQVGFAGIVLDRAGYPEAQSQLETSLRAILDAPPLQSRSTRFAFFDLRSYAARLPAQPVAGDAKLQHELTIHPLVVSWTNGCTGVENAGTRLFHWCGREGDIAISNQTSIVRRVSIKFTAVPASLPAHLTVEDENGATQTIDLHEGGTEVAREVEVPPGPRRSLRFRCDGTPASVPSDVRTLVWRADYPVVQEVTALSAPPAP